MASYKIPGYRVPGQPYRKPYGSNLYLPALFGKNRAFVDSGRITGFLRSIATRASLPGNFGAAAGVPYTNRTFHISRDAISDIQVGWANVALVVNSGENATGTQTQLGQVEYPAGNFHSLNWGGNPSNVAAPLSLTLCSPRTVNIPPNTGFWIESKLTGSVNLLYGGGTQKSLASGDAQQTGGTDMSNVVDSGTGAVTFPSVIVGLTNTRSALGVGDSRFDGFTFDQAGAGTQGNNGDFQTAFSPNYAGTRYGCVGMTGATFGGNHAVALALAAYHTDIIYEFGINDLNAGTSAAALQITTIANMALFAALNKKVWLTTLQPSNTSNNQWIDAGGQTLNAHDAARVTYNTAVRAGIAGAAGFYEYANLVETALNSGKWKFDGTAFKYTNDGTHLNNFSTPLAGPFTLT